MGTAPDDLLPLSAAAEYLGVADETLRRWVRAKKVRHIRLPSGQSRFRRADLDEVLTPVEPKDVA